MGRRSGIRLYATVTSLGIGAAILIGAGILPTLRHERQNTEAGQHGPQAQGRGTQGPTPVKSSVRRLRDETPYREKPNVTQDVCSGGLERLPLGAVMPPALSSSGELDVAVILALLCG